MDYICSKPLQAFHQSAAAGAYSFAVVCWGCGIGSGDANKLNKLESKSAFVVGLELDSLYSVDEKWVRVKHPGQSLSSSQGGSEGAARADSVIGSFNRKAGQSASDAHTCPLPSHCITTVEATVCHHADTSPHTTSQ